jgi:hypothetical protein
MHTPYSDPGRHAPLIAELPADPAALGAVIRNVHVHYRASGIDFPPDRLAEIDSRRVERMLDADQGRFPVPLAEPRPIADRIVGCCRDAALLGVSAFRAHGIAARTRVGFADYLQPGYHCDHVITEYHDGDRWVAVDLELDPAESWPVDLLDVPLGPGGLRTAAQVWTAYRRGEIDVERCGVGPGPDLAIPQAGGKELAGAWFVRNYVLHELAHRHGDELLLWDTWGQMSMELDGDLDLIDEVAALLLAADAGDAAAEHKLAGRYAEDPRLHPGERVLSLSPRGVGSDVVLADQ